MRLAPRPFAAGGQWLLAADTGPAILTAASPCMAGMACEQAAKRDRDGGAAEALADGRERRARAR